jgi:hypothetical protein
VVSLLLTNLPDSFHYKIIFMERDLEEVLTSQRAMLMRRAERGEIEPSQARSNNLEQEDVRLRQSYVKHLRYIRDWLKTRQNFHVLYFNHGNILANPQEAAHTVAVFLSTALDESAMAQAVDPGLYRQRCR